jgi:heme/copper-type cytochrome/quinol oxidase subunit 2
MLGAAMILLIVIAIVGALVYVVVTGRRRADRDPAGDRRPEATDRSRER